jgi:uncharacterized protein (DUF433 family)
MRIGLFTAEQVCELCGISLRELSYSDKSGLVKPRYVEGVKRPSNRLYTFRDVVGLRAIGLLRDKYKIPLPDLRRLTHDLKKLPDTDWSLLTFYLGDDGRAYFRPAEDDAIVAPHPPGHRLVFRMREIIHQVDKDLIRFNRRKPEQLGKIDQSRQVAGNATVIAGTRIPTAAIFRLHQAGYSADQIISEFPRLRPADIEAAIKHEEMRFAG